MHKIRTDGPLFMSVARQLPVVISSAALDIENFSKRNHQITSKPTRVQNGCNEILFEY